MKNMIRTFALAGCAALVSMGSLQASVQRVTKLSVPFDFKVSGATLPAGEYQIEQETGSEVATMTHVRSGKRVRLLNPTSLNRGRQNTVEFVPAGETMKLKIN